MLAALSKDSTGTGSSGIGSGGYSGLATSGPDGTEDDAAGDDAGVDDGILERLQQLESLDLTDEAAAIETIQNVLTPEERAAFLRSVASGDLAATLGLFSWQPWWSQSLPHHKLAVAAQISELEAVKGMSGNETVPKISISSGAAAADGENTPADDGHGPAPPMLAARIPCAQQLLHQQPLPPLSTLLKTKPSLLLRNNLVNILFAYVHILRLYAGDWHDDPVDASLALDEVSGALGSDGRYSSIAAACAAAVEASQAPNLRLTSAPDSRTALSTFNDVCDVLKHPHFVVDALLDARGMAAAAAVAIAADSSACAGSSRNAGSRTPQQQQLLLRLQSFERKLHFYCVWAHETLISVDAGNEFDRIAAGIRSGIDFVTSIRDEVFACLEERISLLREAAAIQRRVTTSQTGADVADDIIGTDLPRRHQLQIRTRPTPDPAPAAPGLQATAAEHASGANPSFADLRCGRAKKGR